MARTDPRPNYGQKRRVRKDGYIDLYIPDHPLARKDGYVGEHRKIMWDAGLLTDPELEVHHKNEIKTDNYISNLEVKTGAQHALDHAEERGKVTNQFGIWAVKPREERVSAPRPLRPCRYCGEMIPLTLRRHAVYCSSACRVAACKQQHPEIYRRERLVRPCQHCGEQVPLTRRGRAIYCSEACNQAAFKIRRKQSLPARSCQHCGEPIAATKQRNARFCGDQCQVIAGRQRLKDRNQIPPRVCPNCGDSVPITLRRGTIYCSKRCQEAPRTTAHSAGPTAWRGEAP